MGIIVAGQELDGPDGVVVRNFNDPAVFRFKNRARATTAEVTEVIVHETVTRSWAQTVSVLKQRGLGVHFIVDADGTVYQHADLQTDEMWHASQHNHASVGIEIVNPFEPRFAPKGGPWEVLDNVPWSAAQKPARQYLLPPPTQAEAVCRLLNWLTSAQANPIAIPQRWPGLMQKGDKTSLSFGRVAACATPTTPGILAHMYFGHGDGAWPVLYSWLRLEPCLDVPEAYEEAKQLAQGAWAADLTKFFDDNPYLTV